MRSSLPKMLHPICGRPMVAWPVLAALEAGAARVAVIVPPHRDLSAALPKGTETVVQDVADGTGGAVRSALHLIHDAETVLVVPGDHPLISGALLSDMLDAHRNAGAAASVMSVELDDPGAYGRLVRDDAGEVDCIVETKHADRVSDAILAIREISTSTFAFEARGLVDALERITTDNEAGEYYLGDVLPIFKAAGKRVIAFSAPDPAANLGVNNRADLAIVAQETRRRILEGHMVAGVTVTDPSSTWVDADVEIAADVTLEPGSVLHGATRIGAGSAIGPHTTLIDAVLGENVRVPHSYLIECEVASGCSVGPFAYLRPGAHLAEGAKAGTFVEVKNSRIGEGAKIPHLSYVGDTDVGAESNIGAGTITANYDGFTKNRTKIGERARISVHTSLVAPVEIGDDAYTGAGAVIREDVPDGALGVSKAEQRNIEGFAERKAAQHAAEKDPEPKTERKDTGEST